jgi:hypothetical protein
MSVAAQAELRALLDALVSARGAEPTSPERFRERIYRDLAEHDEPVVREIGEQLRNGTARPHQLLAIPAYAEVFGRGLANLRRIDPAALRETLVAYIESRKAGGGPRE